MKRKQLLSILLSLALVVTMIPAFGVVSNADEGAPYYIWVAGTWVTDANKADVLGDGTVSYDPGTATLTLNNANITGKEFSENYAVGIYTGRPSTPGDYPDVTIRLVGDNKVTSPYHEINSYGITGGGRSLTITGSGSLTVESGIAVKGDSYAIETSNKLIIESGTIHATGGSSGRMRGGLNGYDGVAIHGGTVTADVKTPSHQGTYGIFTFAGDIIVDGGNVTVSAGTFTDQSTSKAFYKEPILSSYPGKPVVKWSGQNSGSGAVLWDGKTLLSNTSIQYVSISPEGSQTNPFVDVSSGDYYYGPVLWAYYHEPQITNGIDATHFAPLNIVKRCESVTFLWRASGCPEPKTMSNPFTDVKATDYFYKPVLWAVENNITKGTTATTFDPGATLSTAHMITFLYRTMNPGKDGWYEEAANWSYDSNHLPFGVNLKVNNTTNCPRGAVVTFLYRCLESPVVVEPLKVTVDDKSKEGTPYLYVRVSGGVSPYTYDWQKIVDGKWQESDKGNGAWLQTFDPGIFRCIVTDSKGTSFTTDAYTMGDPDADIPIEQVDVSITVPVTGKRVTYALVLNESYSQKVTYSPEPDKRFSSGTVYTATAELTAKEGYCFTKDTKITVNGESCTLVSQDAKKAVVTRTFPRTAYMVINEGSMKP
ncbi:MAG: S-layer homology domain-containing protein [Firmicutes bacterium]|nr:S-layer homology domain-containing protein [Bacillota bacterium]